MAWTQADLEAIDRALLDDTVSVQFADGRRVQKHGKADMLALRKTVSDALTAAAGKGRRLVTIGRIMR